MFLDYDEMREKHYDQIENIISGLINLSDRNRIVIRKSNDEEDSKQATDMVATIEQIKIAIRIRTYTSTLVNDRFLRDFTIRSRSRYGNETERDKLYKAFKVGSGYPDFYLYGWENKSGSRISEMIFLEMSKMCESDIPETFYTRKQIPNKFDGTAFIAIPIHELFDAGCVAACKIINGNETYDTIPEIRNKLFKRFGKLISYNQN